MAESSERIQRIRSLVGEIEQSLASFQRRAGDPPKVGQTEGYMRLILGRAPTPQVAKMVRFTDERDHALLVGKVRDLYAELNRLEAEVEDEIAEGPDEEDEDDDDGDTRS